MITSNKSLGEQDLYTLRFLAKNAKVISFDFFDTLFLRPFDDPEDTFDIIGIKYNFANFRKLRRKAQTEAFREMTKEGRKEINLKNIYNNFPEVGHLRLELEEAEYSLELELVEPNPVIMSFFNEMVAAGKKVIITSDMYFDASFFSEALEKYNIKQVPLYISADQNATKRDSGEIFENIIRELSVKPDEILHIGDNQTADVIRPGEKGILTWHYNPEHLANKRRGQSLIGSIVSGLHRTRSEDIIPAGTFSELGYKFQAPATWGFLKWIKLQCITDGITKLLFVSRDGYSLELLAKEYFKEKLPSFDYFMGSRIAFNLALITEQNFISHIPFLMSGSDGLSPGELLERIGVEPPNDEVMQSIGIPASTIIAPDNYELVSKFLTAYRTEILKVCQLNRRGLFMYLRELGIKPGDKIGMVDVGWSGTTQEAFEQIVKSFMDVEVVGYYFCLANTPEKKRRESKHVMKALVNTESASPQIVDKIYENRMAVELFFSAPHETIIGYNPLRNRVIAVADVGRAKAKNHNEIISSLNHGLASFTQDYLAFSKKINVRFSPLQLAQPMIDLVTNDNWRNDPLFGQIENFDSWASSRNQTMKFADYFKKP
ncbi:HAD family hydrolase [Pantoea cypripedii]|uniref:HAD family hydrolase n=1 Tax=Pantoea cypripedii TaxID=55209 RepID=UPI00111BF7C9|nr:haloacid dehalogenase [Pantoea cypripedii]MBP2198336.1 putative HAD superfamily hydrolase [Pantoea cypripedii]